MKNFHFKILNSTTLKAEELLEMGQKTPFSLTTERQTHGRGRNGKKWESPEGGLYFQAVYPYELIKTNRIPQKIACIIAEWFEKRFKVKLTIKWPNDLLYQNKKIAGIICEVLSVSGKNYLSIGIGINISKAPKLENSLYSSISLSEITGQNYKPCEIGLSFQDSFKEILSLLKNDFSFEKKLKKYFIPKGSIWRRKEETFTYEGMNKEGFMILKNKNNKLITVHSSFHPYSFCNFKIDTSTPNKDRET